ncbi:hypothetical protein QUF76_09555, partial [Desulfobacterales bacterium HSG16]|nr:hypothetical protein [Desulfobacterales bacterium HSG16]
AYERTNERAYDKFNDISPVSASMQFPEDRRSRNPLITKAGFENFLRLRQHPHAPIWNFETGDRIIKEDVEDVKNFEKSLKKLRTPYGKKPPERIIKWIYSLQDQVPAFSKNIPGTPNMESGIKPDIKSGWQNISTLERKDIAVHPENFVPLNSDLSRLIVYDTSGSTGHCLAVPHHPAALGKVLPMMEFVLERYNIRPEFSPDMTACINVGTQAHTVIFPNVITLWNEAGFAKVNLHPGDWRKSEDANRFFSDMAAPLITGDPVSFAEMMRWQINIRPEAMFATALRMPEDLSQKLAEYFNCPIIDWYSVSETGPIGYICPEQNGFHILPHDIFVEILDSNGNQVPDGQLGEITVTGGRNPYLPLLRYKTGDTGSMDSAPCPCGDPMPRIMNLSGREPVLFYTPDKKIINPVDIGRALRDVAFVQYSLVQREDFSCDLTWQPMFENQFLDPDTVRKKLAILFGDDIFFRIKKEKLSKHGGESEKVRVYRSELWGKLL